MNNETIRLADATVTKELTWLLTFSGNTDECVRIDHFVAGKFKEVYVERLETTGDGSSFKMVVEATAEGIRKYNIVRAACFPHIQLELFAASEDLFKSGISQLKLVGRNDINNDLPQGAKLTALASVPLSEMDATLLEALMERQLAAEQYENAALLRDELERRKG